MIELQTIVWMPVSAPAHTTSAALSLLQGLTAVGHHQVAGQPGSGSKPLGTGVKCTGAELPSARPDYSNNGVCPTASFLTERS